MASHEAPTAARTSTQAEFRPARSVLTRSRIMPKLGVIGMGYWGPNLLRNFHALVGQDLRACCDCDLARAQAASAGYPGVRADDDPRRILEDATIEAVVIATPVHTHHELAKAALLAGKHVLVEKPLCNQVEQAAELVELARARSLVLMVDHTYVYSPAVRIIQRMVEAKELGELLFIDSVRINLGLYRRDVNVVWDLAPHDLSVVDFLLGRLPRSISAFGSAHAGREQEEVAYLNLDFGDGLIANFHVNWLSPVKLRYTMIGGSQKSIVYNDLETTEKVKVYDCGLAVREDDLRGRRERMIDYRTGDVWSPHISREEPLRLMAAHFLECIASAERPLTDGEAGLRVVRLLDAAWRSIKAQGGRITL